MVGAAQFSAGVICAAVAGALWGATFAVPQLLPAFSASEIAFARFAVFGFASLLVALVFNGAALRQATWRQWRNALLLSVAGNIGYYLLLILAIRHAGPALPTLIIGTLPVTLALVANLRQRQTSFADLLPPLVPIIGGLFLVHASHGLNIGQLDGDFALGIAAAFAALVLWTLYGVFNAELLQAPGNPAAGLWASMTGIATLPALLLAWPLMPDLQAFSTTTHRPWGLFIILTLFMGIGSSWAATWFWNRASALLPTVLAGQLIVFETLFGLFFVFLVEGRYPNDLEVIGGGALIIGVLWAIRRFEPESPPQPARAARKRKI